MKGDEKKRRSLVKADEKLRKLLDGSDELKLVDALLVLRRIEVEPLERQAYESARAFRFAKAEQRRDAVKDQRKQLLDELRDGGLLIQGRMGDVIKVTGSPESVVEAIDREEVEAAAFDVDLETESSWQSQNKEDLDEAT